MGFGNCQAHKPTRAMGWKLLVCCVLVAVSGFSAPAARAAECTRPEKVCESRAAVFRISAFDPVGSAVRIGPKHLITSRHIVAIAKQWICSCQMEQSSKPKSNPPHTQETRYCLLPKVCRTVRI